MVNNNLFEHKIEAGINFLFYVAGRCELRILPYNDRRLWLGFFKDPFLIIQSRYGSAKAWFEDLEPIKGLWSRWLAHTIQFSPDDVQKTLRTLQELIAENQKLIPQQQHLLEMATLLLPEYLNNWEEIKILLQEKLKAVLSNLNLQKILKELEALFSAKPSPTTSLTFYYHMLPAACLEKHQLAVNTYLIGAAFLEEPPRYYNLVRHLLIDMLLEQSKVFEALEVRSKLRALKTIPRYRALSFEELSMLLKAAFRDNLLKTIAAASSQQDISPLFTPEEALLIDGYPKVREAFLQAAAENPQLLSAPVSVKELLMEALNRVR